MKVRDARRQPFAWLTRDALARIRECLPVNRQAVARNALLALAEAASLRHDGDHTEGDALSDLAALAGVSTKRLREHLQELVAIGLVAVESRRDLAGRSLPSIYVLCDAPGSDVPSHRGDVPSDRPDANSAIASHPTRAGDTDEEVKKAHTARTREHEPGNSLDQARGLWRSLGSEIEQQTLRAVLELAESRGLCDGWQPPAVLTLVREEFSNRDAAGEAARFRDYYSTGGHGENAPVTDLVGLWRRWLSNAPSLDTLTVRQRPGHGSRRARPTVAAAHGHKWRDWAIANVPELPAEFAENAAAIIESVGRREVTAAEVRARVHHQLPWLAEEGDAA